MRRDEFLKLVALGSIPALVGIPLLPGPEEKLPELNLTVSDWTEKYHELLLQHRLEMERAMLFGLPPRIGEVRYRAKMKRKDI